jgi:N-acetylglucosamine-6-phosphate deacetylase
MTRIAIVNGRIAAGTGVLDRATLRVDAGRIEAVEPGVTGGADETIDLDGGWLMPGFVDTQVNGGGGVLFNDAPSVEGIRAIGAAHAPFGTTAFLPTLISDDPHRIVAALAAAEAAIEAAVPGVVGVHIEGPFLNVARKGIHDETKFRRLDGDMLAILCAPHRGRVVLTLAPELCDPADVARLIAAGVIVSAGHSDATYAEFGAARAAGMTGVTHLFNAMSPLHHRTPGVVGAALDDQQVYCGLIADGVHVHPATLRIACRARPADRLMLVTDAMPSVGTTDKNFMLQGRAIHVEDGICVNIDGTLAGSDLDMAGAVRTMIAMTGIAPETAAVMAATAPAAFLGLSHERGRIAPGLRADWVRLDRDFQPRGTWIGGMQAA